MGGKTGINISDTFFDRYKIISVLGKGGMGTVYLAEDLRLKGKRWAIKEIIVRNDNYQQFIDEAKILITLEHPYLPKIIDYYSSAENYLCYLVIDYINGKTLKEIFEQNDFTINIDSVIKYSLQLCDLFDYLHNKQSIPVIYRDLKPSNIMIDEFDNVRLIDFGIARKYKEGNKIDTIQMGTVGFAAPEQFENKQTDQRTDIYSLGALMYYFFSNGKYYYLTQKSLSHFRNDLNPLIIKVINKMLKNEPEGRYQNISDVREELKVLRNTYLEITEKINITNSKLSKEKSIDINRVEAYSNYQELQSFSTKQIIVANLSKRAGATFITVNFAKYLSELNITTSVIELPFEPYIFDYIGLDRRIMNKNHNNKEFYSLAHEIFIEKKIEKNRETLEEGILWIISDPRKPLIDKAKWTYNNMLKLLYNTRKSMVSIIDIGSYLEHESIYPLLDGIDMILVIIDPMPSEIILNLEKTKRLTDARKKGQQIEFVINNWTENINESELIEVLGRKPISYIPNISLSLIHKSIYKCEIPYSNKEIKSLLAEPFKVLSSKVFPNNFNIYESQDLSREKKFFSKWLRR